MRPARVAVPGPQPAHRRAVRRVVVVVESPDKGGALLTADEAVDRGRPSWPCPARSGPGALPARQRPPGRQRHACRDAVDVLVALGLVPGGRRPTTTARPHAAAPGRAGRSWTRVGGSPPPSSELAPAPGSPWPRSRGPRPGSTAGWLDRRRGRDRTAARVAAREAAPAVRWRRGVAAWRPSFVADLVRARHRRRLRPGRLRLRRLVRAGPPHRTRRRSIACILRRYLAYLSTRQLRPPLHRPQGVVPAPLLRLAAPHRCPRRRPFRRPVRAPGRGPAAPRPPAGGGAAPAARTPRATHRAGRPRMPARPGAPARRRRARAALRQRPAGGGAVRPALGDVDLARRQRILVWGKGAKQRMLPDERAGGGRACGAGSRRAGPPWSAADTHRRRGVREPAGPTD